MCSINGRAGKNYLRIGGGIRVGPHMAMFRAYSCLFSEIMSCGFQGNLMLHQGLNPDPHKQDKKLACYPLIKPWNLITTRVFMSIFAWVNFWLYMRDELVSQNFKSILSLSQFLIIYKRIISI